MAEWSAARHFVLYGDASLLPLRKAFFAGLTCHFGVQDPRVPYHANGTLLNGHQEFEGAEDEEWRKTTDFSFVPKEAFEGKPLVVREFALRIARNAYVSPRRLWLARHFNRADWNALVRSAVRDSYVETIRLLSWLKAAA
jgi:hypothetical protein